MGNSSLKGDNLALHENWVAAVQPASNIFSHINLYRSRLLINTVTMDYIEEYIMHFISEQDFKLYVKQTKWRQGLQHRDPSAYILPIRAFIDSSSSQLCSRSYTASIYFDRIEMRLTQINDIPFFDSLYMLRVCLQGFKVLYEHFGCFNIGEDQIFINSQGEVKVWIHPNLSSVKPNIDQQFTKNVDKIDKNNRLQKSYHQFNIGQNINANFDYQKSFSDNAQNNLYNKQQPGQQSMVKQIIFIVENNIDNDTVGNRIMFSNYVKNSMAASVQEVSGNETTRNRGYNYQKGKSRNESEKDKSQGSQKFKSASTRSKAYTFSGILDIYQKYVQQLKLSIPRRIDVICGIYKHNNNGIRSHNEPTSNNSNKSSIVNSGKSQSLNKNHLQYSNVNGNGVKNWENTHMNNSIFMNNFDESAVTPIKPHERQLFSQMDNKTKSYSDNSKNERFVGKIQIKQVNNSLKIQEIDPGNILKYNLYSNASQNYQNKRPSDQKKNTHQNIIPHNQNNAIKSLNSSAGTNFFPSKDNKSISIPQTHGNYATTLNLKLKSKQASNQKRLVTQGDLQMHEQKGMNNLKNGLNVQHINRNSSMQQKQTVYFHDYHHPNSSFTTKLENYHNNNSNINGRIVNNAVKIGRQAQMASTSKYHSPLSTLLQEKHDYNRIVRTTNPQLIHNHNNVRFNCNQGSYNNRHTGNESPMPNSNVNNIKYVKSPYLSGVPPPVLIPLTPKQSSTNVSKPNSVTIGVNHQARVGEQISFNKAINFEKYIREPSKIISTNDNHLNHNPNKVQLQYRNYNSVKNDCYTKGNLRDNRQQNNGFNNFNQNIHENNNGARVLNIPKKQNQKIVNDVRFNNYKVNDASHKTSLLQNRKYTTQKQRQKQKQIKYYTSNQSYQLDSEIAGDLAIIKNEQDEQAQKAQVRSRKK